MHNNFKPLNILKLYSSFYCSLTRVKQRKKLYFKKTKRIRVNIDLKNNNSLKKTKPLKNNNSFKKANKAGIKLKKIKFLNKNNYFKQDKGLKKNNYLKSISLLRCILFSKVHVKLKKRIKFKYLKDLEPLVRIKNILRKKIYLKKKKKLSESLKIFIKKKKIDFNILKDLKTVKLRTDRLNNKNFNKYSCISNKKRTLTNLYLVYSSLGTFLLKILKLKLFLKKKISLNIKSTVIKKKIIEEKKSLSKP